MHVVGADYAGCRPCVARTRSGLSPTIVLEAPKKGRERACRPGCDSEGAAGFGSLAATVGGVRADCGCGSPCGAPQYVTVTVCQMVPVQEQVQVTRYRMEAQQENYTTYNCEVVPEQHQVTCTCMVPK